MLNSNARLLWIAISIVAFIAPINAGHIIHASYTSDAKESYEVVNKTSSESTTMSDYPQVSEIDETENINEWVIETDTISINCHLPKSITRSDDIKSIQNPYKFRATELIAPVVLMGIGASGIKSGWIRKLSVKIEESLQKPGIKHYSFDNYLQVVPTLTPYVLNLAGVKGVHDMIDCTIIYGTAYVLLGATLFPLKYGIHSERPNGKNFHSFPSGHTAIAFVGAEVLRREYWNISPWIGVGGYLVAATTGFMRIYNDAHWLTDVLAGAGLGILCAEAAYWLYPVVTRAFFHKRYKTNIFLSPDASRYHIGISAMITF